MIREDKFLISKRPYAVDLGSLKLKHEPASGLYSHEFWRGNIDGVWFRRRQGVTMACIGSLWDYQDVEPADGEAFLRAHKDGRYGGSTYGRWDGSGYWGYGGVSLKEQNEHLAILQPMLENFPEVPDSYSGWWRF